MSTKLTDADYKARMLELANFLDSLNPLKFYMGSWCEPDHTCKTTACISGWAGILFSDSIKQYLDNTYKAQKLNVIIEKHENTMYRCKYGSKRYKEVENIVKSIYDEKLSIEANNPEPDWYKEGKELLGLIKGTTDILFIPSSPFWCPIRSSGNSSRGITNKHAAIVVRYLAYRPNRAFLKKRSGKENTDSLYNEEFMLKYIANQQAKEASHVG